MQIYALLKDGKPLKVRALSPDCPGRTTQPDRDLGPVGTNTSFAWLRKLASPRSGISSDVLAAIAVHDGAQPRDELVRVALHHPEIDNRKDAIFWMGQVRIDETCDVIDRLIREDDDSEIREAAVFALAQLPGDRAADALIAIVMRKSLAFDTRKSALFWLAQSESDLALSYFSTLLAAK
jgi:HEAT repeat protein